MQESDLRLNKCSTIRRQCESFMSDGCAPCKHGHARQLPISPLDVFWMLHILLRNRSVTNSHHVKAGVVQLRLATTSSSKPYSLNKNQKKSPAQISKVEEHHSVVAQIL
jgi:hypothetical protein